MYYVQLMIWLEQVLVSVEKVVMYVAAEHYRAVGRPENLGGPGRTGGRGKCLCHREKNTLEPKAECFANDKVKSPPVFRSLYDDF